MEIKLKIKFKGYRKIKNTLKKLAKVFKLPNFNGDLIKDIEEFLKHIAAIGEKDCEPLVMPNMEGDILESFIKKFKG